MKFLYFIIIISYLSHAQNNSFDKPTDNFVITQYFASYNVGSANKWHTGLDAKNNAVDPYSYSTNIKAIGNGTIHKIFGLEITGNNLRRYNSSTNTFSWTSVPTPGMNHGLGICVIIYHSNLKLYSLYGHLDAVISGLSVGQSVSKGQIIGRMGNSYKQYLRKYPNGITAVIPPDAPSGTVVNASDGFGPHVHLEVKDRGVLSALRTDDEGPDWGYTPGTTGTNKPGHPNYFGYHDPNIFFNNSVELLSEPTPVEIIQAPLNVRDYPSTSASLSIIITSISARTDNKKPAFSALRKVGGEWFQIYLPNAEAEGWSASGWIAGNLNSNVYSQINNSLVQATIIKNSSRVFESANSSSNTIAFVYGENTNDCQRFIKFDETSNFIRIYLPEKAGKSDGWLLKSDVNYVTNILSSFESIPITATLTQNYPNPFNPTTTISYSLPQREFVSMKVYDVLGNEIVTLVNEEKALGNYSVEFDGSNLASGIYFYSIQAGAFYKSNKMILAK